MSAAIILPEILSLLLSFQFDIMHSEICQHTKIIQVSSLKTKKTQLLSNRYHYHQIKTSMYLMVVGAICFNLSSPTVNLLASGGISIHDEYFDLPQQNIQDYLCDAHRSTESHS